MKVHWERLLLAHAEVVFKYLLKIGASKEDAEDVVQEAIMKTIECLHQIEVDKLRAWLFKVALHRYYTLYNKKKTVAYFSEEELAQFKSAMDVEEEIILTERDANLREVLQGLPPNFQQLLVMKYFMDLSYKEIAAILDVKEAHVKTYLQRARKALRVKWEEFDE
ncbi:RNA polymerase sigma factor [Solibacillus sp. FSL H8-0538]|uniref:RNA polymerase sigma factor n=1 Tax=Solibacillus sp. FSL H8-0538 TaxID=2921400 RepID=UPI0030F6B874